MNCGKRWSGCHCFAFDEARVAVITRYSAGLRAGRSSRVRFPAGTGNFSFHHRVQNGSGAYPAPYPMGTGALSLGVKRLGCEADRSPPYSARSRMCGAIPPLPQYALMACPPLPRWQRPVWPETIPSYRISTHLADCIPFNSNRDKGPLEHEVRSLNLLNISHDTV
jgi:hypothetical protein